MINIITFITSLNVSCLRRFIIYSENDNCSHLSKINFSKLFSLGGLYYCFEQLKNIRNPIWNNMVESWTCFIKSMKIKELEETYNCPLWKKSHVSYNGRSAPLLFALLKVLYLNLLLAKFQALASRCSCGDLFESCFVEDPEDRFSRVVAHMIQVLET